MQNFSAKKNLPSDETLTEIISFIGLRLENIFAEQNFEQQFISMSMNNISKYFDIIQIKKKLEAITRLKDNENLTKVIQAFKRINNILKKINIDSAVNESLFNDDIENLLYVEFQKIKNTVEKELESNNFETVIITLAELGNTINNYFEKVMVMDKNENIKNNRLSMLMEISAFYKEIYAF